jgi:protein-tyrosine-phosphatase
MMAEGIMRDHWAQHVGRGLYVSSMGIHGIDQEPPTDLAIRVSSENGIDIASQRSRPLIPDELKQADLILVMEKFQKEFVLLFFPNLNDRVFLLGSYPEQADSKKSGVKDPVGGTVKDYRKAFATLSDHIDRIIPLLRAEYGY